MDDSLQLSQQTGLRQRLTPQQVMFGRYLEMTTPEVEDEVRRALDENPALEEVSPDASGKSDDQGGDDSFNESAEELQAADYADEDDIPTYRMESSQGSRSEFIEPLAADDSQSIVDALKAQLADFDLDECQLQIAYYIIGNIDSNGYLNRSYASMADDITIAGGIDTSAGQVEAVANVIRSMDPAGIAAFDLRDCLLLQLRRMQPSQTVADATLIVSECFDLFSKRHFDRLKSRTGLDDTRLRTAIDLIRSLNPKPGALIENSGVGDRMSHIVPDFNVEVDSDGNATISINGRIPELAISESFDIASMPAPADRRQREAMAFVKARHDEAQTLIRMLSARAETLMRVMQTIVRIQHRFFAGGSTADIRPMILKDIAAATGYDLSVISRATAGKYVATPRGIFPLKMLFNERRKEDSDTSAHEILAKIQSMIDSEDKHHPLTDEAIKDALTAAGYDIARRTVAKYREQLGLPVARLRRQM